MLKIMPEKLLEEFSFLPGESIPYTTQIFTMGEFAVNFQQALIRRIETHDSFLLIPYMGNDVNAVLTEVSTIVSLIKSFKQTPYSIDLLLPYLPYGRYKTTEKLSYNPAVALLNNIENLGFIYTLDVHNLDSYGILANKIRNISHYEIFNELAQNKSFDALIIPDNGAHARVSEYDKDFTIIKFNKRRLSDGTIEITCSDPKVYNIKSCIILDDIVDSAGTLLAVVQYLCSCGVSNIDAFVTHGLFSEDTVNKIQKSKLREIYVANLPHDHPKFGFSGCKVQVLDAKDALARMINKI